MVLRDAALHAVLDDRHRPHEPRTPMQTHHPLPTLLHLPHRLPQIPVLAPAHHIHLLRPAVTRFSLPRLLHAALLPAPGARVRHKSCGVQLVITVRHDKLARVEQPVRSGGAVPRQQSQRRADLYLVTPESGHEAEFLGPASVHCAVLAVGADGVQPDDARQRPEGRDSRSDRRARLLLLRGCVAGVGGRAWEAAGPTNMVGEVVGGWDLETGGGWCGGG